MKNYFWPEIVDLDSAQKAVNNGSAAAFFVAIVTGIATYLETSGKVELFGLTQEAYIDAGLFLIIGIGIAFHSRIAAIAGLGLYCFEQVVMFQTSGPRFSVMMIFIVLAFIAGVRGCFEWHTYKKLEKESENQAPVGPVSILTGKPLNPESPAAETEPKKFNFKKFCYITSAVFFAIAVLIFAVAYFTLKPKKASSPDAAPAVSDAASQAAVGNISSGSAAIPSAPATGSLAGTHHTFHLKSGDTVSGNVMMEDADLVVVKSGAKEEVIPRADIASIE